VTSVPSSQQMSSNLLDTVSIAEELSSGRYQPPAAGNANMAASPKIPTNTYVHLATAPTPQPILRATYTKTH
jgi:hypothetical protein